MNPIARYMVAVNEQFWNADSPEEQWRKPLVGPDPRLGRGRSLLKRIPSDPRYRFCIAPFRGQGGPLMRLIGRGPWAMNPLFCGICLDEAPLGGAEIEFTMLFADIRGSTPLAAKMSPMAYSRLINRLVSDQVTALYLPGFAGPDHAARAVAGRGRGDLDERGDFRRCGTARDLARAAHAGAEGQEQADGSVEPANLIQELLQPERFPLL